MVEYDIVKILDDLCLGDTHEVGFLEHSEVFPIMYPHILGYDRRKYLAYYRKFQIHAEDEKGSKVLVWMISRMGDVGITKNLVNAIGYDRRVDPITLRNWEFTRIKI